jgi:hypothetical protein
MGGDFAGACKLPSGQGRQSVYLNKLGLGLSFWHTLSFDYEYWNQRVE